MEKVLGDRSQFILIFFAFSFGMILSNLIGQSAKEGLEPEPYLLTYRGIDKDIDDLPEDLVTQLKALESDYQMKRLLVLHDAGLRFHLYDYAQQHELSLDQAGQRLFAMAAISEAELAEAYASSEELIAKPYYEVKGDLRKMLEQQQARTARATALNKLITKGDLIIN